MVYGRLRLVRHEDLHDIRAAGRLADAQYFEAVVARFVSRFAFAKPDDNLKSAVAQVLRLSMPLAAVADNCNRLALQYTLICIFFVIHSNCH